MDRRLLLAAETGDVEDLRRLLKDQPLILSRISFLAAENPLHISVLAGHLDFVKEITSLKTEFTRELNEDGFSPLHMAAANGDVEIVRELLKVDLELCQLEGKEKMTPFHIAAAKGKVLIIKEMILAWPKCIEDVNIQRENALHIAVKNSQYEAARFLVTCVKQLNTKNVINMKDDHGNTVLHLATWRRHRQVIELLVEDEIIRSGALEINAVNQTGLTALDLLLIFPSQSGDREIADILWAAGAKRAPNLISTTSAQMRDQRFTNSSTSQDTHTQQPDKPVEYFKFRRGRDSPSDVRSALLVIVTLVATATFQVGINPPAGLWQDAGSPGRNSNTTADQEKYAGKSILGTLNSVSFGFFAFFNSVGLYLSLFLINILISNFPLRLEFQICMWAVCITYNIALSIIAPENIKLFVTILTSILPVVVPIVAALTRPFVKSIMRQAAGVICRLFT